MEATERANKKKQIELLQFMGFNNSQICKIVNLDSKTVRGIRIEIAKERQKELKNVKDLPIDIINQYKRLLEEAWINYQKAEGKNKAIWMDKIRDALEGKSVKLEKYGYIKPEPERIDVTSQGQTVNETILINLINKVKDGNSSK